MDRLIEAVAEYLCRHRSVGLLRLTLDLTRRGPELFAEIGAVEVVRGAAAKRRYRYARGGWSRRGGGRQLDRSVDKPQSLTAKNGVLFRLFFFFCFYVAPKNGASILPNAE